MPGLIDSQTVSQLVGTGTSGAALVDRGTDLMQAGVELVGGLLSRPPKLHTAAADVEIVCPVPPLGKGHTGWRLHFGTI